VPETDCPAPIIYSYAIESKRTHEEFDTFMAMGCAILPASAKPLWVADIAWKKIPDHQALAS
jgi:hypothetical protein